tara:strand:- start:333 stop:449 length:117 start_codon:yes stop_codon:yes gene_type:complete
MDMIQNIMGGGTDEIRNKNKKNIKREICNDISIEDVIN